MTNGYMKNAMISLVIVMVSQYAIDYMTGYETPISCDPGVNDYHWNGTYYSFRSYPPKSMIVKSSYIRTKDGTDLACDVYISSHVTDLDHKVPTILHLTRHGRSYVLDFPLSMLSKHGSMMNPRTHDIAEKFVSHGYAWVAVDIRGSGASFGSKLHDFSNEEANDSIDVLDWIISQSWSNGKVGSYGLGYEGLSSLVMASTGHKALKGVILNGAPIDVFNDAFFPGGLLNIAAAKLYSAFTWATDHNMRWKDIPSLKVKLMMYTFGGNIYPVNGNHTALNQAVMDHNSNPNLYEELKNIQYRDDKVTSGQFQFSDMDVIHRMNAIAKSNVSIYSFGGYYDMGVARSSILLYDYVQKHSFSSTFMNRLTLGPWSHSGVYNSDPYAQSKQKCFQHIHEIMRYFDHILFEERRQVTNLNEEDPIHYFTLVENVWKTSKQWPPLGVESKTFYFSQNTSLSIISSTLDYETTNLNLDYYNNQVQYGTSRWAMLNHIFLSRPEYYHNRDIESSNILSFTSDALPEMEITGEVELKLFFSINLQDVALVAYLEDVDYTPPRKGQKKKRHGATYITEAIIRPIHQISSVDGTYSYLQQDQRILEKDQVYETIFHFLPVSYLMKKGHRLRVSIAPVDGSQFLVDHLHLATNATIYHGKNYPSSLVLPVMKPKEYEPKIVSVEEDNRMNVELDEFKDEL